ncbi:hypothetical protein NDU88_000668 [Pleurodeles waltl]|uniref:Uncharacterized protein n=1 Tax=Pleurodeles waltl TaxID=8319 RepID=A0AAV7NB65_PLEWA|nr:hypothetical protein NDU88_000668 [Pleurodeles waltl]
MGRAPGADGILGEFDHALPHLSLNKMVEVGTEQLGMGLGQFLQNDRMVPAAQGLWDSFPGAPKEYAVVQQLQELAGRRKLITHLYAALDPDKKGNTDKARDRWALDCTRELTEFEWKRACEPVKSMT